MYVYSLYNNGHCTYHPLCTRPTQCVWACVRACVSWYTQGVLQFRSLPQSALNVYSPMVYIPPDVTLKTSAWCNIFTASTEYFSIPEQPGLYTRQEYIPCLVQAECSSFLVWLVAWLYHVFLARASKMVQRWSLNRQRWKLKSSQSWLVGGTRKSSLHCLHIVKYRQGQQIAYVPGEERVLLLVIYYETRSSTG